MFVIFRSLSSHSGVRVGEIYEGWRLLRIVESHRGATIGGWTFHLQKGLTTLSLTNDRWPGDKQSCYDHTLMCVVTCPPELWVFAYRDTTVKMDRPQE